MQGEAPPKTCLFLYFRRIQALRIMRVLNPRTSTMAKDKIVIILILGFGVSHVEEEYSNRVDHVSSLTALNLLCHPHFPQQFVP